MQQSLNILSLSLAYKYPASVVDHACRVVGRLFHTTGLKTAKLMDPFVVVLVLSTNRTQLNEDDESNTYCQVDGST